MAKIIDKIVDYETRNDTFFSLEFFPPKTDAGVENLYLRMDRMTALQPIFIDVTWGAGGTTKDLTMAISSYSQKHFGVDVLMHLTCTNMTVVQLKAALVAAKDAGIRNLLALRGDPPKGAQMWQPVQDGFTHAIDLVRFIRQEFGDYFCVAVAGFPEGHPQTQDDAVSDIRYLKEKIDAGADFVLTQFFYDTSAFIKFFQRCRASGIKCPIIPGMMPIQSYKSFQHMTSFCRTSVPQRVWDDLLPLRDDDEAVKAYGARLCSAMCHELRASGALGFHFYTLNLEKSVLSVLDTLGFSPDGQRRKPYPWRGVRYNNNGRVEDVRPINWANRPQSYIRRTDIWDEFPNGRWGDIRSPAFGELSDHHFYRPFIASREDRLTMWGEAPLYAHEIHDVFAKYIEGKIPLLPWSESPLHSETRVISSSLVSINRMGFLTINSQPAVNGLPSDHQMYGWGGTGGLVYQKTYVEFFVSPKYLTILVQLIKAYPSISMYAVDAKEQLRSWGSGSGVTALTWGIFPNKEVLQPTIFDPNTFVTWSQEAFQLWLDLWASLYDDETDSSALIYSIHDTYLLVAMIDNDFVSSSLFSIFDEVVVKLGSDLSSNSDEK